MFDFPDGFNPLLDRYDKRAASRLFAGLWPNPDVSLSCAKALADSIRFAHEAGDACWGITMFPNHRELLRLNVGQVEVLTLAATECRFLFHTPLSPEDASPGKAEIGSGPCYAAVPVPSGVCYIAANNLPYISQALREAHNAYIRAAASFKRRSPFQNSFSPAVLEYLEEVLGDSLPRPSYFSPGTAPRLVPLPEELHSSLPLVEGAKYMVTINAYERNPEARSRCIAHYGASCVVCGFRFGAVYGALAEGFIHVHHLKPLSEIGKEYEVDPIADLRPVCANCHAIIHLGGECRSIDEARSLVDPRVLAFWASFSANV